MEVKIKLLKNNAVVPTYAKEGDAGMDLTITDILINVSDEDNLDIIDVGFGIALEIPIGHVGLLFPRSSIYKKQAILSNSVGVIDSK